MAKKPTQIDHKNILNDFYALFLIGHFLKFYVPFLQYSVAEKELFIVFFLD
jgi:hypothetical protein